MSTLQTPKLYNYDRYVISTILHLPDGKGPHPAVVLIPEFMGLKEDSPIEELACSLCENGIIALRFDPTGSGQSEGAVEEDYYMSNIMNDIDIMVSYLGHQDFVKKNAIGLWGQGMGGILAISFTADYPSEIKTLTISSTPASLESLPGVKGLISDWEKKKELEVAGPHGRKTVPFSFLKDARRYDASTVVAGVECPILTVIDPAGSGIDREAQIRVLEAQGGTGTMVENTDPYPFQAVVEFFRKNLA